MKTLLHLLTTATAVIVFIQCAVAQEVDTDSSVGQSGYEGDPEFGGPEGVSGQLKENDKERSSIFDLDKLEDSVTRYFEWKRGLNKDHGLSFGTSLYLLYQNSGDTQSGTKDNALGGVFRYQGSWNMFGRGTGSPGRINWRLESRFDLGGFQSPSQLSGAVGAGPLNTGFAYSHNFDLDLALINWTQNFKDNTAGYAVGRLGFDVYLDAFPFQTFSRGFINRAFILNPTMAATGIGALGAVVKGFVSDNIWLGAQMHDANAASGKFDFDTVQEGEWLTGVEFGWTPAFSRRKTDRIQFTYWHKDARTLAGTSKGSGWVVSAAYQVSDTLFPFIRFGDSDGGAGVPAETAISAGIQITHKENEIWSIGAGWAKPSDRTFGPGLDNEMVLETSYQFRPTKNFSVMPDMQVIFNPVNNPAESSIWVFGLRAILTL
jgi:porin